MAADSRTTLETKVASNGNEKTISFDVSNSTNKLFCTKSGVGISTCGSAGIGGKPIAGFIDQYAIENASEKAPTLATKMLAHFRNLDPQLATVFHVVGYDEQGKQRVFRINTHANNVDEVNPGLLQGATWNGETDVLTRMIQPCWLAGQDGKPAEQLPAYPIPWNFFYFKTPSILRPSPWPQPSGLSDFKIGSRRSAARLTFLRSDQAGPLGFSAKNSTGRVTHKR